ncbi:hypothetical protein PpBr36_02749 [Pyricularia pennisetigena]|uniref:hypothetical protein n=1 Tax=Pyricularia pennisetigena TaxID=1578925 RepID=UPI00114F00BD|nr:hypothetical protein PpBr36_02749 [Pyricularia pennisetigena]TLS31567.1 hypothetical protein PpBr36_02749 [Pyricularia pennisetigena]
MHHSSAANAYWYCSLVCLPLFFFFGGYADPVAAVGCFGARHEVPGTLISGRRLGVRVPSEKVMGLADISYGPVCLASPPPLDEHNILSVLPLYVLTSFSLSMNNSLGGRIDRRYSLGTRITRIRLTVKLSHPSTNSGLRISPGSTRALPDITVTVELQRGLEILQGPVLGLVDALLDGPLR